MSSSFKVANSTISYGTLTSNSVKAATVTTGDLRASIVELDAPAGTTTRTVKLYAPTQWAGTAAPVVYALSTVKGESQTGLTPATLAPSAFLLPAYAMIDYVRFGCKYTGTPGAQTYDVGLSASGTGVTTGLQVLAAGPAVSLNTAAGNGSGLAVNNVAAGGSTGVAPVAPVGPSQYVTVTSSANNSNVATGETLEVHLTYTTASA
jgi:hypothetical protein